jgi:hypothetical protein
MKPAISSERGQAGTSSRPGPDPNKVSPLNSLAWSDASSNLRCKFVADIGVRAWLAAIPPEWLPELERYVEQHRVANPPPLPAADLVDGIPEFLGKH